MALEQASVTEVETRAFSGPFHVLIGASGSVACIKLLELVTRISRECACIVRVVVTSSALHFIDVAQLQQVCDGVLTDADEWSTAYERGSPILHIELRRWADVFLVAPLTANSLSALANGAANNLLSTIARAWSYDEKPLLIVPAMNVAMWRHPITAAQLATLRQWGAHVIAPMSKRLACGDVGVGAMAELDTIIETIKRTLQHQRSPLSSMPNALVHDADAEAEVDVVEVVADAAAA